MKVKIYTLGCKINQYDSNELLFKLKKNGFDLCGNNADLVVVNTCAVTKNAIRKDKRMIQKAKKENPEAKIVVLGCWSQVYDIGDKFDLVCGVENMDDNIDKILKIFDMKKVEDADNNFMTTDKARYFIKVQDGCEQFCSYCIIPYTRGKMKSVAVDNILMEIKQAVKNGHEEIILSGIHLGLYFYEGNNLVDLIKKIIKIRGLGRIRLSSIEITEVSDELINLIVDSSKICKHLHISLQSGCDKILKTMKRPYNAKFFYKKVQKIRKKIPDISLTTDVIVGFPGESDADFQDTVEFIKKVNFSQLHIFQFSAHEKTDAYHLKNQNSGNVKKERAEILRKLSLQLEKEYKKSLFGKELSVVIENIDNGLIKGKTEYYFDIFFKKNQLIYKADEIKRKKIVKISLKGLLPNTEFTKI